MIKNKITSIYFRAPTGSGKSVLLQLFGEALAKDHPVYCIGHVDDLNHLSDDHFKRLEEKHKGRKVFLLVDEVQANVNSARWNYLLKRPTNIVTIGMGIPREENPSPQFSVKRDPEVLLLRECDLDNSLNEFLSGLLTSKVDGSNTNISAIVETMIRIVLTYTSGHAYPFLKILEYCCTERVKDSIDAKGEVWKLIKDKQFINSTTYANMVSRSFAWDTDLLDSADKILSTGVRDLTAEAKLFRLGYWNRSTSWFISDLFLSFVFNKYQIEHITSVDGENLTVEKLIEIGLSELTLDHFRQYDDKGQEIVRYEDGISWYFGYNIARRVRGLHTSPQHVVNKVQGTKSGAVDYYFNSHLNSLVEVVRNSDRLEEHFKKFVGTGGYVSSMNWWVLDILTHSKEPALLTDKKIPIARTHEDKFYTFTVPNNTLWRGKKAINDKVSRNLVVKSRQYSTMRHLNVIKSWVRKFV